jgi:hypothetical protein
MILGWQNVFRVRIMRDDAVPIREEYLDSEKLDVGPKSGGNPVIALIVFEDGNLANSSGCAFFDVTGATRRRLMLGDRTEHPEPSEDADAWRFGADARVTRHSGGAASLGARCHGRRGPRVMAVGAVAIGRN